MDATLVPISPDNCTLFLKDIAKFVVRYGAVLLGGAFGAALTGRLGCAVGSIIGKYTL